LRLELLEVRLKKLDFKDVSLSEVTRKLQLEGEGKTKMVLFQRSIPVMLMEEYKYVASRMR
jgi:hypothetical protein